MANETDFLVALIRPSLVLPVTSHQAQQGVPPLGLAYLAGALKAKGFRVNCIDSTGERLGVYRRFGGQDLTIHGLDITEVVARIPLDAKLIGVSCMYANEWIYTKELVHEIKNKFPGIPLIVGGEFVTADFEYLLDRYPDIDICVRGEGEATIVELAECLRDKKEWHTLQGLAFRNESDQIQKNPNRARIQPIESIPLPDWDSLPLRNYLNTGHGVDTQKRRSMPMLASRGCPYRCSFCTSPSMWTRAWNARAPQDVVDEMKSYMDRYQVDHFEFYDLTVVIDPHWLKEFCEIILRDELNITWSLPTGTRTEALNAQNLTLLKRSGCLKMSLSPESGSRDTLKRMHKHMNPEHMLSVIRDCSRLGVITKCNLIFGLPDQTLREAFESIWYLMRMAWAGANDVACFSFVPYPGSELFDKLVKSGRIVRDENYENFLCHNIYNDTKDLRSWSDHISNWQMPCFVIGGMGTFYLISFTLRPARFFQLIYRLVRRKPSTMLEMLLDSLYVNFVLGRKRKST